MITLFGATGYTGRIIAQTLDRSGLPFRVAGRSAAKLAALSEGLVSRPAALVADVHRPETLGPLFEQTQLVINCAGPFTDLGEQVVAQSAARGVHYLDITNELAYVHRLRRYDELARRTGAAIVPACGFEVAIADCAIDRLAADQPQPFDEAAIVYVLGAAAFSVGTRLSALRTFATSWLAYRDGRLVHQAPGATARSFAINEHIISAIAFPSAEAITLPAHCAVRNVTTWLAVARRAAGIGPQVMPAISWLLRTPLGWLTAQILKRIAPPPGAEVRAKDRFAIQLEVRSGTDTRTRTFRGYDPYGLTAEIATYAAKVITAQGYACSGVLAPAQALDAEAFLKWLETCGVR